MVTPKVAEDIVVPDERKHESRKRHKTKKALVIEDQLYVLMIGSRACLQLTKLVGRELLRQNVVGQSLIITSGATKTQLH